MSVQLSQDRKKEIFKEYLNDHLNSNKKDQVCRRALFSKVGRRKRFLTYLMRKDILLYRSLIKKLGIRK